MNIREAVFKAGMFQQISSLSNIMLLELQLVTILAYIRSMQALTLLAVPPFTCTTITTRSITIFITGTTSPSTSFRQSGAVTHGWCIRSTWYSRHGTGGRPTITQILLLNTTSVITRLYNNKHKKWRLNYKLVCLGSKIYTSIHLENKLYTLFCRTYSTMFYIYLASTTTYLLTHLNSLPKPLSERCHMTLNYDNTMFHYTICKIVLINSKFMS